MGKPVSKYVEIYFELLKNKIDEKLSSKEIFYQDT